MAGDSGSVGLGLLWQWEKKVEQPSVHALVREIFDLGLALCPYHVDRAFDQITHHPFDISADITHFRELRCFDLDEGSAGQLR